MAKSKRETSVVRALPIMLVCSAVVALGCSPDAAPESDGDGGATVTLDAAIIGNGPTPSDASVPTMATAMESGTSVVTDARVDDGGAVSARDASVTTQEAGAQSSDAGSMPAGDGGAFGLTSPNHANGAKFAAKYTCTEKGFNGSIQPELRWTPGPTGTKSYAITFIDRTLADKGMANGFHWVIYDIPASVMMLPEGLKMPSMVMAKAISGAGSGGAYLGPCPNFGGAGANTDTYEFTLYALAEATTAISGTGTAAVRSAEMVLESKNLAKAKLSGTSDAKPP